MNKKTPETSRRKPRTAPSSAKSKPAPDSQPVAETTVAVRELMIGGRDYSSLRDGRRLEVNVGDGVLSIRRKQGCVMKTLVDGAPLKLPVEKLIAPTAVAPASIGEELSQDEMAALKGVEAEAPTPVAQAAEPVVAKPLPLANTDADTLDDDLVRDIFGEVEPESEESPAPDDNGPAEAPEETFSEFVDRQSREELQESRSWQQQHAAPAHFAHGIQASGTPTPPLGSRPVPKIEVPFLNAETQALPMDSVQAAELARIEALRGKVGTLEERFGGLNKQAQALLKGKPATSGTDILTIITLFNDLKIETTNLLNSLLGDAVSNKGLIGRLKQLLDKDIKGVLVDLNSKQQNGVETDFFAGRKAGSEVAVIPVNPITARQKRYNRLLLAILLTAAAIAGARTCAESDSSKSDEQKVSAPAVPPEETTTTDELIKQADELIKETGELRKESDELIKEIEENPIIKLPADASPSLEEIWNKYIKQPIVETPPTQEEQPATDLNLESVGTTEPSATTTTTFNCEVDTTGTAQIECVEQGAPDADVTENLAWTGPYNTETGTVPAEVTLKTPDGQQFVATFNAQIGTRQKLSWTLEAVKAE